MKKMNFDLTIATNALICPNPSEWYSKAYLSEDIANNYRVIPGVKNSTKVANATFTSILKAESCDFSASASALSAITMSVCPVQAQVEICKKTLESSFVCCLNNFVTPLNGATSIHSSLPRYQLTIRKKRALFLAKVKRGN